jgi:hypothetical protein
MDLVSRTKASFLDRGPPRLPLKLGRGSHQDLTWEEAIIALLKHGHIWEANSLFAIRLRHGRGTGSELIRVLDAVPKKDDTMYDLVRLTMVVLCSRSLLQQGWHTFARSEVFDRCEDCVQDSFYSDMDGITDPVTSSRAYQNSRLLDSEVGNKRLQSTGRLNPSSLDERPDVLERMQDIRERATGNSDYMLLLASYEQSNHPLPDHWLHNTGASKEAVECLHPNAVSLEVLQYLPSPANDDALHTREVSHTMRTGKLRQRYQRRSTAVKNQVWKTSDIGLAGYSFEDRAAADNRTQ